MDSPNAKPIRTHLRQTPLDGDFSGIRMSHPRPVQGAKLISSVALAFERLFFGSIWAEFTGEPLLQAWLRDIVSKNEAWRRQLGVCRYLPRIT